VPIRSNLSKKASGAIGLLTSQACQARVLKRRAWPGEMLAFGGVPPSVQAASGAMATSSPAAETACSNRISARASRAPLTSSEMNWLSRSHQRSGGHGQGGSRRRRLPDGGIFGDSPGPRMGPVPGLAGAGPKRSRSGRHQAVRPRASEVRGRGSPTCFQRSCGSGSPACVTPPPPCTNGRG
jgi:hypothetical protein